MIVQLLTVKKYHYWLLIGTSIQQTIFRRNSTVPSMYRDRSFPLWYYQHSVYSSLKLGKVYFNSGVSPPSV